ncbi:hypothetical protein F4802DRAFT_287991 [Xylaria palmicola]|nr:hypothetical protein F4802DRAFT_287991 [Xylaria palmicola]
MVKQKGLYLFCAATTMGLASILSIRSRQLWSASRPESLLDSIRRGSTSPTLRIISTTISIRMLVRKIKLGTDFRFCAFHHRCPTYTRFRICPLNNGRPRGGWYGPVRESVVAHSRDPGPYDLRRPRKSTFGKDMKRPPQ